MNRLSRLLLASATLLSSALAVAESTKTPASSPTAPAATMGPTAGAHESSQSTPSLKSSGKTAFVKLDKDNDGQISKAEADLDPALKDSFDRSDENKDDKLDAGEFARSEASGSPADSAPTTKH